jgi:hypothetical protein
MSFQPVISVTKVPRSATSYYFTDTTKNYPDSETGWGSPGAPASAADIASVWGEIQGYGQSPIRCTDVAGDISESCEIVVPIGDGVNLAHVYYGVLQSLDYTVSADRLTLTFTSTTMPQVLEGISSISCDDTFPARIASVDSSVVLLAEPLPGTSNSYSIFYKYWHAQQRVLVLVKAEATIVNQISLLPVMVGKCESSSDIVDMIMQKLGAEMAFSCGNYAKANEAALIITGTTNKVTQNCTTCG